MALPANVVFIVRGWYGTRSSAASAKGDRERSGPAHAGVAVLEGGDDGLDEPQRGRPPEQGGERDLGLDARELRADAAVHAASERHRSDVDSRDVEPGRF